MTAPEIIQPNTLRLILWPICPRECEDCCNKQWDMDALPYCQDFAPYDTILLTGGEPMVFPRRLHEAIRAIRKSSSAEIYIYTASVRDLSAACGILTAADGMTVTLHEQHDVYAFLGFAMRVHGYERSLRVNIFPGVSCDVPKGWTAKSKTKWRKKCHLPEGETLMRYAGWNWQ